MTNASDPVLSKLFEVPGGRVLHSKLAVWMAEHRDEYAALQQQRGPAWDADARVFVEAGLLPRPANYGEEGPEGDAARARVANTAKQTWHRTKAKAAKRQPRARSKPVSAAPEVRREEGPPGDVVMRRMASLDGSFKERS